MNIFSLIHVNESEKNEDYIARSIALYGKIKLSDSGYFILWLFSSYILNEICIFIYLIKVNLDTWQWYFF